MCGECNRRDPQTIFLFGGGTAATSVGLRFVAEQIRRSRIRRAESGGSGTSIEDLSGNLRAAIWGRYSSLAGGALQRRWGDRGVRHKRRDPPRKGRVSVGRLD